MAEDLLDRLAAEFAATTDLELRLAAPDADPGVTPLEVPSAWRTAPQGRGNLGARLRRTVHDAARDGAPQLALIGADAPLLPADQIEAAFAALDRADAALVPADDGGYVLLALATGRRPPTDFDPLFTGIPWSTDEVTAATTAAARRAGVRLTPLPSHWDVDRPDDLDRLAASLATLSPGLRPRRTAAALSPGC